MCLAKVECCGNGNQKQKDTKRIRFLIEKGRTKKEYMINITNVFFHMKSAEVGIIE